REDNDYFAVQTTNDDESRYRDSLSGGINAEWRNESWTIAFDASRSEADHVFTNAVTWTLPFEDMSEEYPVPERDYYVSYLLNGQNVPDFSYSNSADYIDTNKMALSKIGIYPYENKDVQTAYKTDVKYNFNHSIFSSIEMGVRYSKRTYSADRSVYEYGHDFGLNASATPSQ